MMKGLLFFFLSLVGFVSSASDSMDYNLKVAQPAFRATFDSFALLQYTPPQTPEGLLNHYKNLSKKLTQLEDSKEKVINGFSQSFISRGRLAKTVNYIDYNNLLGNAWSNSRSAYKYLVDRKDTIKSIETLPELLELAISLSQKQMKSLKNQIKNTASKQLEVEKARQARLTQLDQELLELESLVAKPANLAAKNNEKESEIKKAQKNQKQTNTKVASTRSDVSSLTDTMATYATMLGRASACGFETEREFKRVGLWMDGAFPPGSKEQKIYLPIFLSGVEYHMNQQLNGKSPDNCSTLRRSYNSFRWP